MLKLLKKVFREYTLSDTALATNKWGSLSEPFIVTEDTPKKIIPAFEDQVLLDILQKLYHYDEQALVKWLRDEAGSNHTTYFKCNTKGGLQMLQVPEEYAKLLEWLRNSTISSYLEIGIGKASTFLINNAFLKNTLKISYAVDNVSYQSEGMLENQLQDIERKIPLARALNPACEVKFFNVDSDTFFKENTEKFDCIFIDGDHSYEGVKKDYKNAISALNKGGRIFFHDIHSRNAPGVVRLWNEIKEPSSIEFIFSDTCGIGIL